MLARAGVTGIACVLITLLITVTEVVDAAPDTAAWLRSQPQQALHGLMVSIDERLQTLVNVRWETSLKQAEQRIDSLESTVRRLDSTLQDRLDKLERSLNSKEMKEEQLAHQIRDAVDSSYDRYSRRLAHTEDKLNMMLEKMQMTTQASLNRIEKTQEDAQAEVLEAVTLLEDLKSQSSTTEDKLNSTHKAIQQHIQRLMMPSQEELQKISGSLEHLGAKLNSSLAPAGPWGSQNDGPLATDVLTSLRREISAEGIKVTSKINNMYNDLWRRVVSVESLVKDLTRATNMTNREVLAEVRSLANTDNRQYPGDSQENFLEVALDALERKLQRKLLELSHKVESRLDTLSATQNLVMDSCFDGEICRGLESRLSQVLEKIFDVLSGKIEGFSNRTLDLDSLVLEMMELVKTQHSQLIRTVTHNTNMVVTLAKDSSVATKLLHDTVTQLANTTDYNFQDLHEAVQEISNSSGKICLENEKPNEDIVGKQLIPEVSPKNSTEDGSVVFSTTETAVQPQSTPEPKRKRVKNHNSGVLKVTDDIGALGDNNSMASASVLRSVPLALDSSILQLVELMSSNLTQNQKDTLLRFLNSTISLDNLEAVIQNTEAETDYDTSGEIYDSETINKTGVEDELSAATNNQQVFVASETSADAENVPEGTSDNLIPNEAITIEVVALPNGTINMGNETEGRVKQKLDEKQHSIPEDLKTQLKYYALILKIKEGNLNISEFWKPSRQLSNLTDVQSQQNLLSLFENLCYGEENVQIFASAHTNSKMRDRLLLLNQIVSDKDLYEKIENVCNMMTESLTTDDSSEEILPDD